MIEVGEYVRINNDFRLIALGIGEVIKINKDTIYVKMNFELPFAFKIENIAKHSKNLIDLIEVGDYVNGYKVISIDTNAPNDCKECIELDRNNAYEYQWISKNEIKTILTKEMYEANCYTVERKEEC